jgi:hypothetical protein
MTLGKVSLTHQQVNISDTDKANNNVTDGMKTDRRERKLIDYYSVVAIFLKCFIGSNAIN